MNVSSNKNNSSLYDESKKKMWKIQGMISECQYNIFLGVIWRDLLPRDSPKEKDFSANISYHIAPLFEIFEVLKF